MSGWTPVEVDIERRAGIPVIRTLPGPEALPRQQSGPSVRGALGKVEAQSHLGLTDIEGFPSELVVMSFQWSVANRGSLRGRAGMRINLMADSAFGDVSQMILEPTGQVVGSLAGVAQVSANYAPIPLVVEPQQTAILTAMISIPVSNMVDRQNSVSSFTFWVFEAIVWDMDANRQVPLGPGRHENRDWLTVSEVPAITAAQLEAAGGFDPLVVVRIGQ